MTEKIEDWNSYEDLLAFLCQKTQPLRILEWGPGHSTRVMLQECPDACQITSIENLPEYFDKAKEDFKDDKNVELHLKEISDKGGYSTGYITWPLYQAFLAPVCLARYDLIFVDGRSRFDCLNVARLLVKPDGHVIIHDSDRKVYIPAIEAYPFYKHFEATRTSIMSRSNLSVIDDFTENVDG